MSPLWLVLSALAQVPPGADVSPAVAVDVTAEGFDELPRLIRNFVPEDLGLSEVHLGEQAPYDCVLCGFWFCGSHCCDPGECLVGGTPWGYEVDVSGLDVGLEVRDIDLVPNTGKIDLDAVARLGLNAPPSQPALVYVRLFSEAELLGFGIDLDIEQTCGVYVDTFEVNLRSDIALTVANAGTRAATIDATVGPLVWSWNVQPEDLRLSGGGDCVAADIQAFFDSFIFDVIQFNPWDWAVGEVLGLAESAIDDQIQQLRPEIEVALEDAFAAASISEEIEVGDSVVTLDVWPTDVAISPAGMRILLGGAAGGETHPCMFDYVGSGSIHTSGDFSAMGVVPTGVREGHHLAAQVDDDFLNQALYALWSGGLLCQDIAEAPGVPMNTALLGALSSEAFEPLFPETAPLRIVTRPHRPPVAVPGGEHDVTVAIDQLGVDIYAALDGRMARMVGAEIDADAALDLPFVRTTGELTVDLTLSGDDLVPSVEYAELAAGHEDEIEDNLSGLFDVVVEPIIGPALADIAVGLPDFEGLGLTTLDVAGSGTTGDRVGAFAELGLVPYDNGGCDGSGCDAGATDCGGGCSSGRGGVTGLALVGLLAAVRRRRR
jgi:hypothetical protein